MSSVPATSKEFIIGTLGWTADDLDDPQIERLWEQGRYEIVEGVLTEMPPAQLDSSPPLLNLIFLLKQHVKANRIGGSFAIEVDLIINRRRVAVVDGMYLTDSEKKRQAKLYSQKPNRRPGIRFGRVVITPTLIIESVSLGHEIHDRETKSQWYAEAGVPNYWILDSMRKRLDCLVLKKDQYIVDQSGRNSDKLHPSLFPELTIDLAEIWESF